MSLYNSASTSNFREYANNGRFNDAIRGTWAIWVNPTASAPASQQIWLARGDGTVSGDFTCGTPASGTFQRSRASVTTGSGLQSVSDTVDWIQRKWFHFCQTYDSVTNDLRLYIDGKLRVNSTTVGSWTITTTANVRLWMRTNAANPGDHYVEQFGWWRTVFRPDEVDALASGRVDFTKIRREDALVLDRLQDPSQRELVAGLGVNTATITQREAAPIILRPPLSPLAKSFYTPWATRKRYDIAPAAAGDVTVAITGVSATGSVGSVTPSTAVPVTGVAGTSAVGTVTPSTTVAITGVAGTSAVGTVTPSLALAITGVAGTSAVGTVNPGTTVPITGVEGTSAVGSVTVSQLGSISITGVQGDSAVGNVGISVTVSISGVSATASVGTVSPGTTVAVTGVAATGAVGTVVQSSSVALTGVAGTSAVGTVAPSTMLAVTGVAGTAAVGSVSPGTTVGITGNGLTGSVGTVTISGGSVTVAITGVSATAAVGNVTVTGGSAFIDIANLPILGPNYENIPIQSGSFGNLPTTPTPADNIPVLSANYKNVPELTPPTVPTPPGSPVYWFDAQDINLTHNTGIADNDPVGTWSNKGSFGSLADATQASGTARPLFKLIAAAGKLNNLSAIRFDGSNDNLKTGTVTQISQPNMWAVVLRINTLASYQNMIDGRVSAQRNAIVFDLAAGKFQMYAGTARNLVTPSAGAYHMLICTFDGASSSARADLNPVTLSGSPGTEFVDGLTLGAEMTPSTFQDGDIVELLGYNGTSPSVLPDPLLVEAYFTAKYGGSWPQ